MLHYTIHADGGSRGNPGPAGSGALISDELAHPVASVSQFLGNRTNNFAEYEAAILACETLLKLLGTQTCRDVHLTIKMDSELVVKQMRKEYKVKHPVLKEQYARLASLAANFGTTTFTHVPREQNKEADALANEAMDRGSA